MTKLHYYTTTIVPAFLLLVDQDYNYNYNNYYYYNYYYNK